MDTWRWIGAGVVAALFLTLVLLWLDTLREKPGWRLADHPSVVLVSISAVPMGFLLASLLPLWWVVGLAAAPTLAIAVMALAS